MSTIDLSGAQWRKSRHSNGEGNCVEVARVVPGVVAVRDSKNPEGPKLTFTPADWRHFATDVRNGRFDPA